MATVRLIPQDMAGWPEHWQRPSQADLDILALTYARGLVLPHDPVLRRRADPLPIGSAEAKEITEKLYEAARREHGDTHRPLAGIAAPQIGIPARVFLYDPREYATAPPEPDELICVANPEVQPLDDGDRVWWPEGCLSTANVRAWVQRARRIRLIGYTPDGGHIEREYGGRTAIVAQHEVDHLEGILCPARVQHDGHRLWVSSSRFEEFHAYAVASKGAQNPPPWEPVCPADQWEAVQRGVVYGREQRP
jgi:peptide deformylase